MSKITLSMDVTLDMYIAGPNGEREWATGTDSFEFNEFYHNQGALIIGRKTFEELLLKEYWPYQHKEVVVLGNKEVDQPVPYGVKIYSGEILPMLEILKSRHKHIWLVGGGLTAKTFLEGKLIDEIVLRVHPIILGSGKPLFYDGSIKSLELKESRELKNGVMELTYIMDN